MKKLVDIMGSMKTMAVLMAIFAFAIGYATFIENDFGTMSAKAEVFNTRWFEGLLLLLAINLMINIVNFKMARNGRWFVFVFHVSFLVILVGASVTRYAGHEGMMHIREGHSSSSIISSEPFITIKVEKDGKIERYDELLYLSKRQENSFSKTIKIDGESVDVKLSSYVADAAFEMIEDSVGESVFVLMMQSSSGVEQKELYMGEVLELDDFVISFDANKSFDKPIVELSVVDDKPIIKTPIPLGTLSMDTQESGVLESGEAEFEKRILYRSLQNSMVLKDFIPHMSKKLVYAPELSKQNGLILDVNYKNSSEKLTIVGQNGYEGKPAIADFGDIKVSVAYGSVEYLVPFEIRLNKFDLQRYPGSMSPSSYASEVTLIDSANQKSFDYRIYMNNILDYGGYRFFQSSYDQDELGTVLSVNKDPGTFITYIGYTLLTIGMFGVLFTKTNRFHTLRERLKKLTQKGAAAAVIALLALYISPELQASDSENIVIKTAKSFDRAHSDKFAKIIVQDHSGRMKPFDTLSHEIVAKLNRSTSLLNLTPNQVILGMMFKPDAWREIAMIRTADPEINKLIGIDSKHKTAAFSQFFEFPSEMAGYKLAQLADEANRKAPSERNKLDKAVLQVDERISIAYMVYSGSLIRMWPKPNDANNRWDAAIEAIQTHEPKDSEIVRQLMVSYIEAIDKAMISGDWSEADKSLETISKYQKFTGASVYISDSKRDFEIIYNRVNIFEALWPLYFLVGFVLLIFSLIAIVKPSFEQEWLSKLSLYLLILFFFAHTAGLIVRWYISGHAPWSDGYESMIYIGWATVLAGFIFSSRSAITMAATSILTGLILFVAHLNWMDPQVTNLVPVLQSYWLSIHVSLITASYGFLGLGALLGFITLILFVMKNSKNSDRLALSIKELNAINEMSLIIGLVMLTVGNFMGGVWANESWGRYWGWDPKETWALVTILVYAIVLHLRFIKSIYSEYLFSVVTLLAFSSVLMTYFGVNYYLAGLHSYAKGDPLPIPDFVPWTYAIIGFMIAFAFRNRELKS